MYLMYLFPLLSLFICIFPFCPSIILLPLPAFQWEPETSFSFRRCVFLNDDLKLFSLLSTLEQTNSSGKLITQKERKQNKTHNTATMMQEVKPVSPYALNENDSGVGKDAAEYYDQQQYQHPLPSFVPQFVANFFNDSPFTPMQQLIGFAVSCGVHILVAFAGAMASINSKDFYKNIVKPSWAPPAWLFGPAWSVLYTLMAIASWLVWRKSCVTIASSPSSSSWYRGFTTRKHKQITNITMPVKSAATLEEGVGEYDATKMRRQANSSNASSSSGVAIVDDSPSSSSYCCGILDYLLAIFPPTLSYYAVHLVVNALWTWIYFDQKSGAGAFADILLLDFMVFTLILLFIRRERCVVAGCMLIPYLAWVCFATALTYATWDLNHSILG